MNTPGVFLGTQKYKAKAFFCIDSFLLLWCSFSPQVGFQVSVLGVSCPTSLQESFWGILDWKRLGLSCIYSEKWSSQIHCFNTSASCTIPLTLCQEQSEFSAQTSLCQFHQPFLGHTGVSGCCFWNVSVSAEICSMEQPPDTCVGKASLARGCCLTSWFCFAPETLEMTFSVHCAGLQGT